jgi:hypothetical protein
LSRQKIRKSRPKVGRQVSKKTYVDRVKEIEPDQLAKRERYFEIFLIAVLFAFGIYHSVLYFGHTIVPISDFRDLFKVGRDILSFRLPSRFKQVPVLGMLQFILSKFVGGQHPDLTAGWLLNAILHPFNLILLWLVGRRIVGKSALWLAIIAILHPWVIYMLTEPIIETTLLFFSLLTFYFIFKRSKWCYLFASITTMVRYEGAALILAAFVMDMIYGKDKREKIRAFVYSAVASVPLALWMLGTVLAWKPGTSHYFNVLFTKEYAKGFAQPVESRTGLVLHMELLWRVGIQPLLMPYPGASTDFAEMLWKISKAFAFIGFFFGSVYGLCKRQWKILALLIFFAPYFVLHALYPYPLQRFHTNIFWIALLICWFGLQSGWKLLDRNGRVPRALVLIFQAAVVIIAIVWFVSLVPYLSKVAPMSPTSASLPYVAMILVALIFAVRVFIYKARYFLRELSILALMCLVIVSNQFPLVRLVGDGQRDKEFKLLADWCVTNAKPGEKLGIYMAGTVKMFAPEHVEYIVGLPKADNPSEFIKNCYDRDITYVVWATREGLRDVHTGYRQLGLDKNIALLGKPKSTGPYQFITQVGWKRGYVNIFRLRRSADGVKQELPDN